MYNFEKLKVWQKSMEACESIYKVTRTFPREETFGLKSQLRRAITSVPLNIAEGSSYASKKDFARFLRAALGSQFEAITIIKLSYRLNFLSKNLHNELLSKAEEIGKLLYGLINSLKTNN